MMKTKPARRGRKSAGRPKVYDLSSLIVWTEDYRAKAEALARIDEADAKAMEDCIDEG